VNERIFNLQCEEGEAGRLDKFLVARLADFSRSRLQGLIEDGLVSVDGKTAYKNGQMIEAGAAVVVRVPPSAPSSLAAEDIPLEIVFENQDLIVVNKPAGMVVHPAAGHHTGTLVHAALAHAPDIEGVGGEQRPGVVHRLDKDTSGLILLAKNEQAHRWLQDQFRLRKTQKVYIALVDGQPPTPVGRIEAAIGRSATQRKLMAVTAAGSGREAASEYQTLETFVKHTLLEVHPVTGRTHQIRLHLAFIGCPVTGDLIYGHKKATLPLRRHFLHAARLSICLPGEKKARTFEAPLPDELCQVLEQLRGKFS